MRIRPEYSHLIIGSKVGAGLQGETDIPRLSNIVDRVLVLDHNLDYYAPHFRERAWLRVMHDPNGGWKEDPEGHAATIAPLIALARKQYGIRDILTENEKIGLEGLGDSPDDYRFYNEWLLAFLPRLMGELDNLGARDVRLWGPALSPGHQEDDGFEGYRLLSDALQMFDGIAVHHYWNPNGGFFGDADFEDWAGRVLRAHRLIEGELGIVKPWAVTEFNRKVNRSTNESGFSYDVVLYSNQCKRYYHWLNSLDFVVATFTFLYQNVAADFDDLSWEKMPGMLGYMEDGWDRQAVFAWPQEEAITMPQVGEGFQKAEALIGPWGEDEIHHAPGTDGETSLAIGAKGYATWRKATNQTVAVCDNGEIWSDLGNDGDGSLVLISPKV